MTKANLNRLEYFVAIAEAGTITAAAKQMRVSKAVVSKHLQLLEEELGATLVLRNARYASLTEAGGTLFEAAQASLSQIGEAVEVVRAGRTVPTGTLRIAARLDLGTRFVAPVVARFRNDYPKVTVDLRLSDARHDPVAARFDISYRVGWLADTSNVARKLADFQQVIVGTPSLLSHLSTMDHPRDLEDIPLIEHRALSDPLRWQFTERSGATFTAHFRSAVATDVTLAVKQLCLSGAVLAVLPGIEVADQLAEGDLLRCAPAWSLPSGGIYAVYPPTPYRSAATKVFNTEFAKDLRKRLK